MRLSECIEIFARRLSMKRGRVAAIANRLQHCGAIPLADIKRAPPSLNHSEMAILLLAILAEHGVESAAEAARKLAASGLNEALAVVLHGQAQPGTLIVKEGGATATIDGHYTVFGKPAEDGPARFATGATLAAIAAELAGMTPAQADAAAAITRIHNGHL